MNKFHGGVVLKFAPEGALLEGGEEGFGFLKECRGLLKFGLSLVDDGGEFILERDGRQGDRDLKHLHFSDILHGTAASSCPEDELLAEVFRAGHVEHEQRMNFSGSRPNETPELVREHGTTACIPDVGHRADEFGSVGAADEKITGFNDVIGRNIEILTKGFAFGFQVFAGCHGTDLQNPHAIAAVGVDWVYILPSVKRFDAFAQRQNRPPLRIRHGITEHIEEDGAEEVVGEAEGLLELAADGVGFVEDPGDSLLLGEGWERDFDS